MTGVSWLTVAVGAFATALVLWRWGVGRLRSLVASVTFPGGAPPASTRLARNPLGLCEIAQDNTITFYPPKTELGQGAHTYLAQAFCDGLGLNVDAIRIGFPDTARMSGPRCQCPRAGRVVQRRGPELWV